MRDIPGLSTAVQTMVRAALGAPGTSDQQLPRDTHGIHVPDPAAEGFPHTQLGTQTGRRSSCPQEWEPGTRHPVTGHEDRRP